MGSSIKINSISIDLAGAANEIAMVKCDHFSIRGFVAETRERDHRKCWPFSEESVSLVDQQNYSLPSLSVPKFRRWQCNSCIKDIDADGTKDCGMHSNSRTITEQKLDGSSSVIPSKSKLNLLTIIDQEKERKTDTAGNAVVNNEDVNCERSPKDVQTATKLLKKVHPRSMDASTSRSKSRKFTNPEQVGNKRCKEKVNKSSMDISSWKERQNVDQAMAAFGSSDIAGVVEDTPPKAGKNRKGIRGLLECDNGSSESLNLAMSGLQRRKTRKVRLLSELLGKANTKTSGDSSNIRKEESALKKESVRGRKRKLLPENNYVSRILSTMGATSENASKSCDSDQGNSESTDSGFDRDPIKGKQKNRRFQVVDEFVPSLPWETSQDGINENNADPGKNALSTPANSSFTGKDLVPCPLSTQRTERKKKTKKSVVDNGKSTLISFSAGMEEGNQVKSRIGPSMNAISQTTRDLLNEKSVGSLFDDRLASDGYFRKYIPQSNDKLVNPLHLQDNDHVRSRDAAANCLKDFGSSSKSNTGGWLRTGADVVDFSSSSNNPNRSSSPFSNFNLRHTPSSAEVADLSSVLQKDASVADRKGKTVMVQEQHGAPRSQSLDRKENTSEEQNDDIPMEIVELMAKNQYERCLPDKEEDVSNKQPSQETGPKSKNALLIDLNETYDNGISLEDNNTSRPPKPCGSNARREEHFSMGKPQSSLDFFPINQPYVPSPFGMYPPTQDNRSNSIRFSGHNCQWLGNLPTVANQNPSPSSFRVLRACNTCQSVPNQYREASHPIWSSSVIPPQGHHNKPVSFNMDQSTKPSSNENNIWNLNFVAAANGKQKCGSNSEFSFGCKHGAGVSSSGSMDKFSSESSIPALHLLSLMDPRLRSATPADQQGNTKFTKRHFPPVNQSKDFIELQTGDSSKSGYSTKELPFDLYNKRFAHETPRKSFSVIPPLGTSSFSFQNAQASWSHHQEKKNKRKDTFAPVFNSHEKSVFASSSDQGKFQLLGASNSMMLPLKFHMIDKENKQKRKAENCNNASARPVKNGSGSIVCSVNRNPADFTIAEPGNVYMLTGESLKVRKRASFKKKPNLCKQDAMKQTKKPVCPATENA
ncbi:Protein EMBRYONIC FLOWER 1 [Cardamine amara subsp. amara]|uniref:Protein EMBRYONIC FLOWER 1 n=1 Tax=Cardamine amara subsp. amara TaxID=228776 RepID=A0ABD1AR46_CARAN